MKQIDVERLQSIYIKWAYNEIFKYIIDHPDKRPIDAIDDFIYMVDKASAEAKTGEQSFLFSVACDTGHYVRDSLSMTSSGDILRHYENRVKIAEAVEMIDDLRTEMG